MRAKWFPAILTAFPVQKLHSCHLGSSTWLEKTVRGTIGSQDAIVNRMNAQKRNLESNRNAVVLGSISWIADELIGIRTLEKRLSKKLKATSAASSRVLLDGIRDLNTRVELLDRALDEFSRTGRAA